MNESLKAGLGFIIPLAAILAFFVSVFSENFLMGIVVVVAGLLLWFVYSAIMETAMPAVTGNIIIVFGVLLSVATFLYFGVDQNMFGGVSLNLEGLSGSAVLLFITVLIGILYKKSPPSLFSSADTSALPLEKEPASPRPQAGASHPAELSTEEDPFGYEDSYEDYYEDYYDYDGED